MPNEEVDETLIYPNEVDGCDPEYWISGRGSITPRPASMIDIWFQKEAHLKSVSTVDQSAKFRLYLESPEDSDAVPYDEENGWPSVEEPVGPLPPRPEDPRPEDAKPADSKPNDPKPNREPKTGDDPETDDEGDKDD